MKFTFKPIGYIHNDVKPFRRVNWSTIISEIRIFPNYVEGLKGLEAYSHIEVFFIFHLSTSPNILLVHPRGRADLPLVGVFSTHSPFRPNPLGFSIVKLLKVDVNRIYVKGLDAYDGTPVIDIKPFSYASEKLVELAGELRLPSWISSLEE
ncbi:MAG: tRNA (N6-threonylcarbamoyladenosine(37)-N6)-methyltransferase TrmO [archaeon GB-1867-097]|nr:tRNA (N6-threonylcarbamoyladenosine(37)-N6)-methyltransferase TrmO [Candidatus Culexmicrobium thermophilum]MCS7384538.1 tRNA (N6-threonylcarbamoyladenosine(37)-N6)-methyltransferase TrmO [Candidatus Culexmicrobium thermophilum]RLE57096.1 MAG: tRNA (N6-threonylcarbamoyladenosine(37)-N6)-methyltransferase TrmO [Candidatus Verstraetearchaeota archaeon]